MFGGGLIHAAMCSGGGEGSVSSVDSTVLRSSLSFYNADSFEDLTMLPPWVMFGPYQSYSGIEAYYGSGGGMESRLVYTKNIIQSAIAEHGSFPLYKSSDGYITSDYPIFIKYRKGPASIDRYSGQTLSNSIGDCEYVIESWDCETPSMEIGGANSNAMQCRRYIFTSVISAGTENEKPGGIYYSRWFYATKEDFNISCNSTEFYLQLDRYNDPLLYLLSHDGTPRPWNSYNKYMCTNLYGY